MEITRETSSTTELKCGHTVVGTVAVPLTKSTLGVGGQGLYRGILVRAAGAGENTPNTDIVYIGRCGVTADNALDTGGFPLLPGASIQLPCDDASKIYAVSPSASQDVAWLCI